MKPLFITYYHVDQILLRLIKSIKRPFNIPVNVINNSRLSFLNHDLITCIINRLIDCYYQFID